MECTFIIEEKKKLREQLRQAAAAIPVEDRQAQDKALFKAFLNLEQVKMAQVVQVFWGVGSEPATPQLVSALLASGKRVALPRCRPGRQMESRLYRGERLVPSAFGIPEPGVDCPLIAKGEIDLLLVPSLAYDRQRYRLGQGGGYYDRFLADFQKPTVGLCYRQLLQEEVPREGHDIPVGLVLTVTT